LIKSRWLIPNLRDWSARRILVPNFNASSPSARCFHSSAGFGGNNDSATWTNSRTIASGLGPKRQLDAALRAKKICDDRVATSLHALKSKAGPPRSMTRRESRLPRVRIDFSFDGL